MVRPAGGKRGRTNAVSDEGMAGSRGVVGIGLEARSDPVEAGAETTLGEERSVKFKGDNYVDSGGFRNSKGDIGSVLGVFARDKARSAWLLNSEQRERTHQPLGCTIWSLLLINAEAKR